MRFKIKYLEYIFYLLAFIAPLFQDIESKRVNLYSLLDMFVNLGLWFVILKIIMWLYKSMKKLINRNKKNK